MTRIVYVLFAFFVVQSHLSWAAELPAPEPDMPSENFTDSGYLKIKWKEKDKHSEATYKLQRSKTPDFENPRLVYEGPDRASFVSGLPNGTYYFRVKMKLDDAQSGWSRTITLKVKHHSLAMAFSLAGVGLIVFLFTVGIVVQGIRKDQ